MTITKVLKIRETVETTAFSQPSAKWLLIEMLEAGYCSYYFIKTFRLVAWGAFLFNYFELYPKNPTSRKWAKL